MRRRPRNWPLPDVPLAAVPLRGGYRHEPGQRNQRPQDQGDRVRPFYVSGGTCEFIDPGAGTFYVDSATNGVQLCASAYVPPGSTGFVKDFSVAPFKPAFLAGSAPGSGLVETVTDQLASGAVGNTLDLHPDSNSGLWTTPFGWECYRDADQAGTQWTWHMQLVQGRLEDVRRRRNIPQFAFDEADTFYLIPNLPVPARGYPNGLPGAPIAELFSGQRVQRIAPFLTHGPMQLIVPSDTTVCIFARWRQSIYNYKTANVVDLENVTVNTPGVYVLGPSFAQMDGFTQPNDRAVTQEAARRWYS